jgi:hypothetical protein
MVLDFIKYCKPVYSSNENINPREINGISETNITKQQSISRSNPQISQLVYMIHR